MADEVDDKEDGSAEHFNILLVTFIPYSARVKTVIA
jgi:hypothetical protein